MSRSNKNMMKSITLLKKSISFIRKNPKKLLPIFGLEILFIIVLMISSVFFLENLADKIGAISNVIGELNPENFANELSNMDYAKYTLIKEKLETLVFDLLKVASVIFAVIFVLYCIFEGLSLKIAYKMHEKIKKGFMARFILASLIFFLLIILAIQLFSGILTSSTMSISDILLKPIGQLFFIIVILLIKYVMFSSMTIMNKYSSMKEFLFAIPKNSIKNIKLILPCFLMCAILLFGAYCIGYLLFQINFYATFFCLFIAVPIALAYAKLMITLISKEL